MTTKSNIQGFDYETRLFVPSAEMEDVVCGSINCVIAPLWQKILNKEELSSLFPYRYKDKIIGGVQKILVSSEKVLISGSVTIEQTI